MIALKVGLLSFLNSGANNVQSHVRQPLYHPDWNSRAWECFCGLLSPELPAFVKIDNTTNGTIGSCDDCDTDELFTSVSFDDKHDTATTTADYPAFDRYGANTLRDNSAIQPAALPDRVAPVAQQCCAVHR
ncbi:hypothetical protein K439DRAFT_1623059 [Ramaria rubella]|nr:hypothetical protein K439DRAFT_1623059 [Ramaria rubella]